MAGRYTTKEASLGKEPGLSEQQPFSSHRYCSVRSARTATCGSGYSDRASSSSQWMGLADSGSGHRCPWCRSVLVHWFGLVRSDGGGGRECHLSFECLGSFDGPVMDVTIPIKNPRENDSK